jgi:XTP/dITP diphosphohydrolase
MQTQLRFLTKNSGKFRELSELIDSSKFKLLQDDTEINELQTADIDALIRDKMLKAFEKIRRPLIVDHTGLQFDLLNGFPGGLTSIFYEALKSEGIARVIGKSNNRKVTAVTLIGYCDGRQVHSFDGRVEGMVAEEPRGTEGFQWDNIFIPSGYDETFSELGNNKKNEISMRRRAFDKLAHFLEMANHA